MTEFKVTRTPPQEGMEFNIDSQEWEMPKQAEKPQEDNKKTPSQD